MIRAAGLELAADLRIVGRSAPFRVRTVDGRLVVDVPGVRAAWKLFRSARTSRMALRWVDERIGLPVEFRVRGRRVAERSGPTGDRRTRFHWVGAIAALLRHRRVER